MHKGIPHPAELDPATQQFVDSLAGGKPLATLSPTEARAVLTNLQASETTKAPAVDIKDVALPVGPSGQTNVRIMRPQGVTDVLPVIIYMHGGGWMLGDRDTHDRLIRELAVGTHAAVVFVDYERTPEARYPVAIEQGYAVAAYVAGNAETFMIDMNRVVIAGDSVGGNMTAVIALLAKERGGPVFKAQVMFYPVTDASMSTKSYEEFAQGPWLTHDSMRWFWDQYLPDASKRDDIHVSPINATHDDLVGLPRALLIVDENDVLRDEGEEYARRLTEAGVSTTSVRYNGTIHDFVMLNALAKTPAVRGAVDQACTYIRAAFAA
jgi:acetyl esterase